MASHFQAGSPAYRRERPPGDCRQAFRQIFQSTARRGYHMRRRAPSFWTLQNDTGDHTFTCGGYRHRTLLGFAWTCGLVVASVAMSGDLLSSFLKRRLSLPPSSRATGIDQIPECLLPTIADPFDTRSRRFRHRFSSDCFLLRASPFVSIVV